MGKKKKIEDPLADLLRDVKPERLVDLISELALRWPEVRRECIAYLKRHVQLTSDQSRRADGEAIRALWWELLPDLRDLDQYGGGDYSVQDHVGDLLQQIEKRLAGGKIEEDVRRELLEEVLPFIKSGNAGMDDNLYEVAYGACYTEDDRRLLARAFEDMKEEWPVSRARGIYRSIGDRDKYLELRRLRMEYGADFHDLATYYWDRGEREQAIAVAEQGLAKGKGRMDELRQFLAERALVAGNRGKYLELEFARATDGLTLDKYDAFKKICTPAEWEIFEGRVLERLCDAWETEQIKIHMQRKEYAQALSVLTRGKYAVSIWDDGYRLKAAGKLERRFPEEILNYYVSGLGNLTSNADRREYARQAQVMAKVRHMYLDILKSESRWKTFAVKIKLDNLRRPAFQEEFARAVPGWRELA